MIRWAPLFAFLLAAMAGCSSTGVGNPSIATQPLTISSDAELEPDAADGGERLEPANLRHAILVLGELRFLACDTNEGDVSLPGPFIVDLAQNRVEPELSEVPIPDGGFCGMDAILAPALRPPRMAGRSMLFSVVRADGTSFLLFADMPGTLRVRPLPGNAWPEQGGHRWLWAMRPRRWLLPSELDAELVTEPVGVDRVVAIDVNRHPVLYSTLRARVARRSTLHLDLDGNRRLDSEERVGEAYIGQGLADID